MQHHQVDLQIVMNVLIHIIEIKEIVDLVLKHVPMDIFLIE